MGMFQAPRSGVAGPATDGETLTQIIRHVFAGGGEFAYLEVSGERVRESGGQPGATRAGVGPIARVDQRPDPATEPPDDLGHHVRLGFDPFLVFDQQHNAVAIAVVGKARIAFRQRFQPRPPRGGVGAQ